MRFFLAVFLIAIAGFLLSLCLPWWVISVVAFAVGLLISLRPGKSFLAGFLGIFLLWVTVGLLKDMPNKHLFSSRMAQVFFLPEGYLFILVASVVGGLIGGLSAWSAALFAKAFRTARQGNPAG